MDIRQQEAESFVILEGGDGGISLAAIDSIGDDLSLDEAVSRLRDLTRQNAELRNTVDTNTKLMQTQLQYLTDWKNAWETDKEDVRQKNEQARQVVTELRADVAKKDAKLEQLNSRIKELETEKKTAPVTVEQSELFALRQEVAGLAKQVSDLSEEKNHLTSAKDEVCRELDQHTKVVGELQAAKQGLEEENRTLESANTKLTQEIQTWMEKYDKLNAEKVEISQQNEKLMSYSLVPEAGTIVADAIPCGSHVSEGSGSGKSEKIMDTTLADLMTQLQELRSENGELKTAIHTKNQEMEALHKKMHDEAERSVHADHEHRMLANRQEEVHQHEVQQLSAELSRLKTQSPRASVEGPTPSLEEMKSLKTQVVSLGNELDISNEKLKGVEGLYQQQKERLQMMEEKLRTKEEEVDIDRGKTDALIMRLQDSVRSLEAALAVEKQDNAMKTTTLGEKRKKFAQLLNDYHESITHTEQYKRQLEGMKSGGRIYQQQQSQIDNLTAQLMAADESMAHKTAEMGKLKQERDAAFQESERYRNLLPVLKAQCDIYKNDFDAERSAREKMHQDKEQLKEETEQLHLENTQLKDEVQRLSDAQVQMIRERHAQGNIVPGGAATLPRPGQPQRIQQPAEEETLKRCPKCNEGFPDIDTLQLHCMDCIQ